MAGIIIPRNKQFFTRAGYTLSDSTQLQVPLNGGKLFVYGAGTSTKASLYSDPNTSVGISNPIVLTADGRSAQQVWVDDGSYKVVVSPADDTDPPASAITTDDNFVVADAAGAVTTANSAQASVDALTSEASSAIAYDVFLIAGQSNAQGHAPLSTDAPDIITGTGLQWWPAPGDPSTFVLQDANDPVGNAQNGSAWPAFCQAYYAATGRKCCIVPAAIGGSSQTAAADSGAGNWDTGSALLSDAIDYYNAAIAALETAGHATRKAGMIWAQGEADGDAINASTITGGDYYDAFIGMIATIRAEFGAQFPVYISLLGHSATNDVGWRDVRHQQRTVATNDPYSFIAYEGAQSFLDRDGYIQADNVHYSRKGYDEMGRTLASNIAGWQARIGTFYPTSQAADNIYTLAKAIIGAASDPRGRLHVAEGSLSGTPGLVVGADISDNTVTDETRKIATFGVPSYDLDIAEWLLLLADAQSGSNTLKLGGGITGFRLPTILQAFLGSSVSDDTGGTQIMDATASRGFRLVLEAGTFTPTFSGSSADPSGTTTGTCNAVWLRVGSFVFVIGRAELTNKGSGGSGDVRIGGFPATQKNNGIPAMLSVGQWANITFGGSHTQINGSMVSNQKFMTLAKSGSGQAPGNVQWSEVANGLEVFFTGFYMTNDAPLVDFT
jgi:hypothetical protein